MIEVADVSAMAVLLPLAAGVAGALNYGESDRTGLVSGAGIGVLVALALDRRSRGRARPCRRRAGELLEQLPETDRASPSPWAAVGSGEG